MKQGGTCVGGRAQAIHHVVEPVSLKEWWRDSEGEKEIGLSQMTVLWVCSSTPMVPHVFVHAQMYLAVYVCYLCDFIRSRFTTNGRETQALQRKCLLVSSRQTGQRHLPQPPGRCTG